jgi:hypothetical protein
LHEKEVRIVGTGQVDLVQGLYDLRMIPKSKNPGILSVAPEVHISGPLDDPEFHAVKRTLLTSLGRGLMHNIGTVGKTLLLPFGRQSGRSKAFLQACRPPSPEPS